MSKLQVKVCQIEAIHPHTGADRLELAIIGGWQCVVKKGQYQVGDAVVYFPPDTVLPESWIEAFGVASYTHHGRIRQTRLRGEPSFGLVVSPPAEQPWEIGEDVADFYGATKYTPPPRVTAGDAEDDHLLFPAYTEVENLRNFPCVLEPGEPIVITEKIHGTNVRVGLIEGVRMAGSRRLRRKEPGAGAQSPYWYPFEVPGVTELLETLSNFYAQVVLYGEVYGPGIQSLHYGKNRWAFAAFDLLMDGHFADAAVFPRTVETFGIPTVPILTETTYSLDTVRHYADGATIVGGGTHIREGVVVRPRQERTDPKVGRVILKYVSDAYLLGTQEEAGDE